MHVFLADFGTHGRVSPSQKRYSLVGTPHWMAPEICENNQSPCPYDTSADIWSLGITCIGMRYLIFAQFCIVFSYLGVVISFVSET